MKPEIGLRGIRLGFLGVGWIGRHRMQSVLADPRVTAAAIADPDPFSMREASMLAPMASMYRNLDDLLDHHDRLDGIVIATPSAGHAEQAIRVIEAGIPVFCQKPLGRTAAETERVIDTARTMDSLLGIDLSYRHVRGLGRMREILDEGGIGRVYAADFVFHNAYGPDKPWFYDFSRAGGGCLMDLGIHLVDLALWLLRPEGDIRVSGRLFAKGEACAENTVEDYAVVRLDGETVTVSIDCSWRLPAGRDAVIEASLWGTEGGLAMRNVNGSFLEFVTERYHGTAVETIDEPPDDWGRGAICRWAGRLIVSDRYDPAVEDVVQVARILDIVYGRGPESNLTLNQRGASYSMHKSETDIAYAAS